MLQPDSENGRLLKLEKGSFATLGRFGDLEAPRLSLRHLAAAGDDERIHAQAIGQLGTGIEFHQAFENFRVHLFRGFVGADVLGPQLLPNAHHPPPEFLLAEGVGGDLGLLSHAHLTDVGFIHVNAHPQDVPVSDGQNGIRHSRRIRDALSTAVMFAQHSSVDGRANERLCVFCLRLV